MKEKKLFEGTMIVTDLDGTLFDSECRVSKENIDAIKYYKMNGGIFTACTGRMKYSLDLIKDLISAPAICLNGSAIFNTKDNEMVWNAFLDERIKKLLVKLTDRFENLAVEIYTNDSVYVYSYSDAVEYHRGIEYFEVVDIHKDFGKVSDPFTKLVITDKHERLLQVEDYLKNEIEENELPFVMEYSLPEFIEFRSSAGGKGNALEKLSSLTGIPLERIVAVGDNMNDLSLFEHAGYSIAVGNAVPELKGKADAVVSDHDHHALRDVIICFERLLSRKYKKCS